MMAGYGMGMGMANMMGFTGMMAGNVLSSAAQFH